ncbi:hypothetical protein CDC03_26730 [Pseudomonas aeruginosa]|nr:hypothetical protein CDC03_26730 [Pseudomonas aeruginosa]
MTPEAGQYTYQIRGILQVFLELLRGGGCLDADASQAQQVEAALAASLASLGRPISSSTMLAP